MEKLLDSLKERVCQAIEKDRDLIFEIGQDIYMNPELGYKEYKTSKKVKEFFQHELGLEVEEGLAITGLRARSKGRKSGPTIAILGELDGIICNEHRDSLENGASHTCGHNIQIAGMLAAALGLVRSGVIDELDGNIDFIACPAEEFIEIGYRSSLREKGLIKYFGGKQELIRLGVFDDIDMAIMFHALDLDGKKVLLGPVSNGFIGKNIRFIGREAHSGSAPHKGVNALMAANLALNNMNAQRESFEDKDRVRIHPIITKGGDIVNVVPSDVHMESYTRARTIEAMVDANKKINRSIVAGAMAMGAKVEIRELSGYLPILRHDRMEEVLYKNLGYLGIEDNEIVEGGDFTGSFDLGDLSHIIPTLHPMFAGIKGDLHSKDYEIVEGDYIYLEPAKAMALTCVDLLFDKSSLGREIIDNHIPKMTKDEYLDFMNSNDRLIEKSFLE